MSISFSRPVISSQQDLHENLYAVIERHRRTPFQLPIPARERHEFSKLDGWLNNYSEVILDNGCGTGESTVVLAEKYPQYACIGIDKSAHRLSKAAQRTYPANARLIRADLVHFLRLVSASNWIVQAQYFFYPNPWPKPGHLKRRWHGHPLFPTILTIGGRIEVRTNWEIYAQEFSAALEYVTGSAIAVESLEIKTGLSRFESKYLLSGHRLFRVVKNC